MLYQLLEYYASAVAVRNLLKDDVISHARKTSDMSLRGVYNPGRGLEVAGSITIMCQPGVPDSVT